MVREIIAGWGQCQDEWRSAAFWLPNRAWDRAFALSASSSRFFGGAVVSSERRRRLETIVISSTALAKELSFAFEGLLNPVILRTNCRAAARTSSSVTGGSKLNRILILRHIGNRPPSSPVKS